MTRLALSGKRSRSRLSHASQSAGLAISPPLYMGVLRLPWPSGTRSQRRPM